jgi:hypothetical protein
VAAVENDPPTHGATPVAVGGPKPPRKPLPPAVRYAGGAVVVAFALFGVWMAINRLGGGAAPPPPAAAMSLQLISDPPGATVILDGDRQALLTPYVFELPQAPSVRVRLELGGYRPHEETVQFRPGERQKALRVVLSPTTARDGGARPDGGPSRPASQSPTIAILELDPSVAWIGESTTIAAQVSFDDPDGDVRSAVVEVKEGPARLRPQKVRLRGAGATGGTAAFSFDVAPSKPAPLTIDVWVTDGAGNTSNRLTSPLEVKAREGTTDAAPSAAAADAGP